MGAVTQRSVSLDFVLSWLYVGIRVASAHQYVHAVTTRRGL
jgi:hypothetical protein